MKDSKDSTGLILLSITIGIIAFALLGKKTATLSAQQTTSPQLQEYNWQPMEIPRVDDIKPVFQPPPQTQPQVQSQTQPQPVIDNQLVQMTSQLEKTASQLEHATTNLQETVSRLQHKMFEQQSQPLQVTVQQVPIQQPAIQPSTQQSTSQMIQPQTIQTDTVKPQNTVKSDNLQTQNDEQKQSNVLYKNNEKWEIIRGKDGRIKSLNIIRDVKKDSQE